MNSSLTTKASLISVSHNCLPLKVTGGHALKSFAAGNGLGKRQDFSVHMSRDHNSMAVDLAKRGRIEKWNYTGFKYPIFLD